MTDQEKRNLAAVDRWVDTYNHAVDKMVDEVYAADCVFLTFNDSSQVVLDHTYAAPMEGTDTTPI